MRAAQVLSVLAELAPDTKMAGERHIPASDRCVLPFNAVSSFETGWIGTGAVGAQDYDFHIRELIAPLLKRARLHDDDRLRLGWMWVVGVDQDQRPVHFPLVSAPIEHRGIVGRLLSTVAPRIGDPELTALVDDPDARDRLERDLQFGGGVEADLGSDSLTGALLERLPRLKSWAIDAAASAGYPSRRILARQGGAALRAGTFEVVAQVAAYVSVPPRRSATVASGLRAWGSADLDGTAFAACYGLADGTARADRDQQVASSIVLSEAQRAAVRAARTEPVTVISGPPGTGKSQTIAAVALDEVARGASVLVAAPSEGAVDALIDLLDGVPGPDPLVFGSNERRRAIADRLGQGGGALVSDEVLERAGQRSRDADSALNDAREVISELLVAETMAGATDPVAALAARRTAPAWFEGADLTEAERRMAAVDRPRRWLRGLRQRRAARRLRNHAGGATDDRDALGRAFRVARAARHAQELDHRGGLDLDRSWAALVRNDDRARELRGDWLQAFAHHEIRVGRQARRTMAAVSAALRSGRLARRDKLAQLDGSLLTRALPLWVGTLRDVDDLLPRSASMFDLVIVDEASQVDQVTAAPALIRASRAVVVGDPKQLRHVSFLSEQQIAEAIDRGGIDDPGERALLDARRMSLFDVAAAVAPTRFLDEHFRGVPHLIGFSARRFYDGELHIATTHPRNHIDDRISVMWMDGRREPNGTNQVEIDAVIQLVRSRQRSAADSGPPRIGIIAPFRAQADAIERRVVEEFEIDEIDELALRVGTVHGFQGCERDLVIVSLALDVDSTGAQRAFVSDANLFNVMTTRARSELVVVTSLERETSGLLGDYLRYGDVGPQKPPSAQPRSDSARRLAEDLVAQGLDVHSGYPAGRHEVDLVVGSGDRAQGVCFGVHPEGAGPHIERYLSLRRAGWDLREVFDSAWSDRAAELVIDVAVEARRRSQDQQAGQ